MGDLEENEKKEVQAVQHFRRKVGEMIAVVIGRQLCTKPYVASVRRAVMYHFALAAISQCTAVIVSQVNEKEMTEDHVQMEWGMNQKDFQMIDLHRELTLLVLK
jgi:hypothetical protein